MADQDTSFTPTGSTLTNLKTYLGNVADAIRSKLPEGTPSATIPYTKSSTINAQEFDEAIFSISAIGDITLTNPASAENILIGKEAVVTGGENITGTMPNVGQQTLHLDADHTRMSISQGYHDGTGYADVDAETITPTQMPNTNATLTINAHGQGALISGDVVITPMDNAVLGSGDSNINAQTISATVTATRSAGLTNALSAASTNYSISFSGTITQFDQDDQVTVSVPVTSSGYLGSTTLSHQISFDPATTLTKPGTIYFKETTQQWGQSPATGAEVSTFTPNFNSAYIFNTSAGVVGTDNAVILSRENLHNYNVANGKTIYGIQGTYVTDLYVWSATQGGSIIGAPTDESDDAHERTLGVAGAVGETITNSFSITGASLTGKLISIHNDG